MEHVSQLIRNEKKKILILSCKGGYGHEAASHAIQEMGKDFYAFEVVFPIDEVIRVGQDIGADDVYNFLIKNNWIRTMNFMSNKLAPLVLQTKWKKIESLLIEHIERIKPDLVLSVIPFVNFPASEAARKCNVPYLLITIDHDLTNWVLGLNRVKHSDFTVTIARSHPLTSGLLEKHKVAREKIEQVGLPVHPSFLARGNKEQIKKDLGVPLHKPVIMVMMGGAGGRGALAYAKEIKEISFPVHVIVCTGNNSFLYESMKKLASETKGDVSFSVLQFTNKVADLMQISDLLITKPGPGTINEALLCKIPILVDNTHSALFWERVNLDFIDHSHLGQVLLSPKEIQKWIPLYLYDPGMKKALAKAYEQVQMPTFQSHIHRILRSMMSIAVPM